MSIWWSLHLRREAASVPLARRLLIGTMETAGVHPETSYELSVALSEACANAVEHGGGGGADPGGGRYRVTAYLDGEKCRIEVADSGPGFPAARDEPGEPAARHRGRRAWPEGQDPLRSPGPADRTGHAGRAQRTGHAGHSHHTDQAGRTDHAEHGRGLLLIEALADHFHVRNRPGRGAVVCFSKMLKWRDGAHLAGGPMAGSVLSP
ncbi:ATP-binding protein [Streptomyces xinghaiensis]|uniref:ATP-binding protein n=1 Tax=Streptomyces xinghaiensis TaxID=1038928 RepID=UPI000BAED14F|nr:ATP-binding protein [Streptomyces xinghaiensis]